MTTTTAASTTCSTGDIDHRASETNGVVNTVLGKTSCTMEGKRDRPSLAKSKVSKPAHHIRPLPTGVPVTVL